jgi:hypothetical protein
LRFIQQRLPNFKAELAAKLRIEERDLEAGELN